jgi:glycosyltransferase involved in cell wall biosynthesis
VVKGLSERLVLFLGRITLQKGPDYFVETANIVLKKMPNVRFVMAGSGDMMNRMVERVAELRIQDRFHFTGFLSGRRLEEMFALSDLFVMPSVSEPFGLTPFEALLYQVPIIISKQSGVKEVLKHAPTVDFWDTQQTAKLIVEILSDEALYQKIVRQCSLELEPVSWASASQKVKEIYVQLSGHGS